MDKSQIAIFRRVADRGCSCDAVYRLKGPSVLPLVMDRGDNVVPSDDLASELMTKSVSSPLYGAVPVVSAATPVHALYIRVRTCL